jgi:signal transduction histidine kinase
MSKVIHELHLFQHELLEAFVDGYFSSCSAVLEASLERKSSKVTYFNELKLHSSSMFQLDYTGSSVGFLSVSSDEQTFMSLVGEDSWGGRGKSIVKGILNSASGELLDLLKKICPVVTLLSPKLIVGEVDYPFMSYLANEVVTECGTFFFVVAIDQRTLDIDVLLRETTRIKEYLECAQVELVQSEKMASLGELVAGVAHEVNTPLGVGVTGVSHLSDTLAQVYKCFTEGTLKKSDFYSFLMSGQSEVALIYENLMRASKLIRNFKEVAVDQSSEKKRSFAIVSYLNDTVYSLSHLYAHRRVVVSVHGDADMEITSYPGAFAQMVTHLISNAVAHAFGEDGGELKITLSKLDDVLQIIFLDDGYGMRPEVLDRIFDPFFTTKRGQGSTGLGLHIVYNVVTQSLGGGIRCQSEEGVGTEFVVSCPLKE